MANRKLHCYVQYTYICPPLNIPILHLAVLAVASSTASQYQIIIEQICLRKISRQYLGTLCAFSPQSIAEYIYIAMTQ